MLDHQASTDEAAVLGISNYQTHVAVVGERARCVIEYSHVEPDFLKNGDQFGLYLSSNRFQVVANGLVGRTFFREIPRRTCLNGNVDDQLAKRLESIPIEQLKRSEIGCTQHRS